MNNDDRKKIVEWAASQWASEVANRPLQNVHRRALDGVWRQVIRHFGGDDVALCGPPHQELVSAAGADYSLTKPDDMGFPPP